MQYGIDEETTTFHMQYGLDEGESIEYQMNLKIFQKTEKTAKCCRESVVLLMYINLFTQAILEIYQITCNIY